RWVRKGKRSFLTSKPRGKINFLHFQSRLIPVSPTPFVSFGSANIRTFIGWARVIFKKINTSL
ncbi:hypothetical protein, partial [Algoriphagus sp.]|uniref:hypothetical protein n=1 Tax=Algoriphagus sp. TaxID=1872435 RepID=UPI003F72C051